MSTTPGSHAPGEERPFFDAQRARGASPVSAPSPAPEDAFDRLAPPMTTPDRSAVAGLWPPEAIEAIRLASVALLERVGVQVDSSRAQELLVAAGC
jgi:trimethylamine:corrinoid methyltransferase-like protein